MRRLMNIYRLLLGLLHEYAKGLAISITTILLLIFCLHPGRFASHYEHIKTEDIVTELERAYIPKGNACAVNISGRKFSQLMYPNENPTEEPSALARRLGVLPGGQWRPSHCQPVYNVAIILPYRNRQKQLNIFMDFIHPFLQSQNLDYRIFVIEQSETKEFNRAKLFNIGFVEATKVSDFHCFIFQDIDLIPQNPDNIYACTKFPRHMSSSVNTFRYNLPYNGLFGGAVALLRKQFEKVNGFSNVYFGWGGEDDDFYYRLQGRGFPVSIITPVQ